MTQKSKSASKSKKLLGLPIVIASAVTLSAIEAHTEPKTCATVFAVAGSPSAIGGGPSNLIPREAAREVLKYSFAHHTSVRSITPDVLKRTIDRLLVEIDPSETLLSQAQVAAFRNSVARDAEAFLKVLNFESSGSNGALSQLTSAAAKSLRAQYEMLTKTPGIRARIMAQAKAMTEFKENPRPASDADKNDALLNLMAYRVAVRMKMGANETDAYVLSLRSTIREFRELAQTLKPEAQPGLILVSVIGSLDAHSAYLPPADAAAFQDRLGRQDERGGIGVVFSDSAQGMLIREVNPGSAAEKAGLLVNDVVTHIHGQIVRPKSVEEISALIKGAPGTELIVRVKRGAETRDVRIVRQALTVELTGWMRSDVKTVGADSLGYISIATFYEGMANDLLKNIVRMKEQNRISGLLIDLRGNGGGSLHEAHGMLDMFIRRGPLFSTGNSGNPSVGYGSISGAQFLDLPLVFIVDENSASASELTTMALKDYRRAVIVGTPTTFGKGSMQIMRSIGRFGSFKLTDSLFHSPGGDTPQNDGVSTHIVLNAPREGAQFERDLPGALPAVRTEYRITGTTSFGPITEALVDQLQQTSYERTNPWWPHPDAPVAGDVTLEESLNILHDLVNLTRR